ncbi:MAG: hypothetical protein HRU38_17405 [Saccharospirillaceae bacterium]|nr:hypothetical protein [Pseudomonadales bacterium]NRB80416.1 hypothetical protein [Saccharospirillaceae bacterium]
MLIRRKVIGQSVFTVTGVVVVAVASSSCDSFMNGNPLPPPPVSFCVDAQPTDAVITINGEQVDQNGCVVSYENYAVVEVSALGYQSYSQTLQSSDGKDYQLNVNLNPSTQSLNSEFCVSATPVNSEILINQQLADLNGCAQVDQLEIEVIVSAQGYENQIQLLNNSGHNKTIDVELITAVTGNPLPPEPIVIGNPLLPEPIVIEPIIIGNPLPPEPIVIGNPLPPEPIVTGNPLPPEPVVIEPIVTGNPLPPEPVEPIIDPIIDGNPLPPAPIVIDPIVTGNPLPPEPIVDPIIEPIIVGNPLMPMADIVCVSVNVEDTNITIAGQEVNDENCAQVYENEALIEAYAPGYLAYTQLINIAEQGYNFEIELLPELIMPTGNPLPPADLVCVNATPAQSVVLINNTEIENNSCIEVMYSSLVDIKINADGYLNYHEVLTVSGETLELVIKLNVE